MKPVPLITFCIFSTLLFTSFLSPSPILNNKYQPGYYIDKGEKSEGYIYFNYVNFQKFNFKKELKGKKRTIRVENCDGFVVGEHRFKVIKDIKLKVGIWSLSPPKAFAEVIKEGQINLYKVYSQVGSGNMYSYGSTEVINFIMEKNNSGEYILVPPNSSTKFKKIVGKLCQDKKEIADKIANETYNLENILKLIDDYNNH